MYLLNFNAASLVFTGFLIVLLAQDLNLRRNGDIAFVCVVFFILTKQVLQVAIALTLGRGFRDLGVVAG